MSRHRSILFALLAAALFGASTPLAKLLVGDLSPWLLGGLLYLGSGIGLSLLRVARDRGWQSPGLHGGEWLWLLGAIGFGGVLGPVALLHGLRLTSGATASLLLNLEAVLTALIAWGVFRENADRRVVAGMAAIVAGGVLLAWPGSAPDAASEVTATGGSAAGWLGPLLIALACLCWAIDNNLTRRVSASDALFIAAGKGLLAGLVNLMIAFGLGSAWPVGSTLLATAQLGFFGYGLSLVLFVLALRGLGAARTGAYFSTAPFIGALLSIGLLGEVPPPVFWLACALMAGGVWLHLSERHEHLHRHEPLNHQHAHRHDAHHQHDHDFAWDGDEPHGHAHAHAELTHRHAHAPDIHHRHPH